MSRSPLFSVAMRLVLISFASGCAESNPSPAPGAGWDVLNGAPCAGGDAAGWAESGLEPDAFAPSSDTAAGDIGWWPQDALAPKEDTAAQPGDAHDAKAEIGPAEVAAEAGAETGAETTPIQDADAAGVPQGCCTTDAECEAALGQGALCVQTGGSAAEPFGSCQPASPSGWCWNDAGCPAGKTCHGAEVCPCDKDCGPGFGGPGVCVTPGGGCTAIDPSWVEEICDAADLVIFDGTKCTHTCPGCCGCEPFCDLTFQSYDGMAQCVSACFGTSCALFDGACDDAIPDKPWYAFDGYSCKEIDYCMCEGCPGAFATEEACNAACFPGQKSCSSHAECAPDQVCLGSLGEWQYQVCGLCGYDTGSCHCGTPDTSGWWGQNASCQSDSDCEQEGNCDYDGNACDDCPSCPKCVNGWCVYETYDDVMCLCNGCG